MQKSALFAVAGLFSLCVSLSAQQPMLPAQFQSLNSLEGPWVSPSLALENQDRFFFSTGFGSMRATPEYLPAYSWQEPQRSAPKDSPRRGKSFDDAVDLQERPRFQVGGEVGFLYGKSGGKYGREDFSSYIIGTVGNEYFSISAGYFHQETDGRYPRWRR